MSTQMTKRNDQDTVRKLLHDRRAQFAAVLPRHIDVERMIQVALITVNKTPGLLDCTQVSLIGGIYQSAQLGLDLDPVLGHAYLIPYKGTVQFMVGYKGFIELMMRTGKVIDVDARAVHVEDAFSYDYGIDQKLIHRPYVWKPNAEKETQPAPGPITHVYSLVRMVSGFSKFAVLTTPEVQEIRGRSPAGNKGPWVTDWEEMAKKTAIRRVAKTSTISPQLQRAVHLDELADANVDQDLAALMPDADGAPRLAAKVSKLDAYTQAKQEESYAIGKASKDFAEHSTGKAQDDRCPSCGGEGCDVCKGSGRVEQEVA